MQSTFHMLGEFLRECAALIVVFVPLEVWKSQEPPSLNLLWHVGELSSILFGFGVVCEYVSLFLSSLKGDLENA
jgi:hypothetical protein